MPGAGGSHAAPWGCPTRTQAGGARDLAGHAKGRLLTCGAAHGDNAAAGGAEQGQQPLGELQRTEEVHLHAGAKLAQRRELGIGNGVIEAGVVHQSPKPCRGGMLKEATLMGDTHTPPLPPPGSQLLPSSWGSCRGIVGCPRTSPISRGCRHRCLQGCSPQWGAHRGLALPCWLQAEVPGSCMGSPGRGVTKGSYLCCWCGPGRAAGRAGCLPAWSGPSAAVSDLVSSSCAAPGRRDPAGPARWQTPESPWHPSAVPSPARSLSHSLQEPRGALQWVASCPQPPGTP